MLKMPLFRLQHRRLICCPVGTWKTANVELFFCKADTLFPGRLNQPQYVNAIEIQRGMQMRCIILQKGINWSKFVIKIFIVKKYWNQNYFCLPNIQKLRDDDGWSFESNRLWTLLWISYYDQVWTLLWISCYNQV